MVEPVIKKPSAAKIWETNNVELDSSFSENPCLMEVWDKLSLDAFNVLNEFFDGHPEAKVTLKAQDSVFNQQGQRLFAKTKPTNQTGSFEIVFDEGLIKNLVDIQVATIVLHEFAHAEIYLLTYDGDVWDGDFTRTYIKYANLQNLSVDIFHHTIMAEIYVNKIAMGVQHFDSNTYSLMHYQSLAWTQDLINTQVSMPIGLQNELLNLRQQILTNRSKCQD